MNSDALEIIRAIDKVSSALTALASTAEATLAVLDYERANDPVWPTSAMRRCLERDINRAREAFEYPIPNVT